MRWLEGSPNGAKPIHTLLFYTNRCTMQGCDRIRRVGDEGGRAEDPNIPPTSAKERES